MIVKQYIDGSVLTDTSPKLAEIMRERKFVVRNEYDAIAFCGFINIADEMHFFWPKTCPKQVTEKECFSLARTLMNTLRKYALRPQIENTGSDESDEVTGISPVIAIEILQDYLRNGLYTSSSPELRKRAGGNVVWNKVFSNTSPLPDKNGRPFYQDLIVRKVNYFSSNEITLIHSAIVAKLDKMFGWYFSDNASIAPSLNKVQMLCSNPKAIFLLKRELALTFAEREIRLLRNLIYILEMDRKGSQDHIAYSGITNFEHVWEAMCSEVYGNEAAIFSDHIPVPAYLVGTNLVLSKSNRQRMDIIISEEKRIAILDAKYYDFMKSKPSWSDLVKQFYYQRSVSAVFSTRQVSNFFIVPGNFNNRLPDTAVIVDSNNTRMDREFLPISVIYHDVTEIMSAYTGEADRWKYRARIF